jgi:aminopeptidase N
VTRPIARGVLIAFCVAGAAGAQNAARAADVVHYDFGLTLPDAGPSFRGDATLTVWRVRHADSLALDLVGLEVDSVLVNGRRVAVAPAKERITVPLPPGSGDTLRIRVLYGGTPSDGLIIRRDTAQRWTYFGDNWPNRARHWLPTIDDPSDKATVSWAVSAPSTQTVVANGTLVERVAAPPLARGGAPRSITRWRESRPIPVYLMVIAAAPLTMTDLGDTACGLATFGRCVPQMVYTAPEQREYMPGPFGAADSIVSFFARLVAPFPFEKLAHLQSSTRFGGMENASEIFYSDAAFRRRTMNDGLIAHETAHQWFGDAVTEREWPHVWLSEGFATYFAALWTEYARGDSAFKDQLRSIRSRVLTDAARVPRLPVIDTVETDLLRLLDANSYQKGGFVLHMLRRQLGDSAFFRGVRAYYVDHCYGNAVSDDLRVALERSSGQPLGWFFDQWLRRPGYPRLTITWHSDQAARQVVVDIEQGGQFGTFRAPLTLEFADAAGNVQRERVELTASVSTHVVIPVHTPGVPTRLVADPDVSLLATINVR